jgi:hypothetical protein
MCVNSCCCWRQRNIDEAPPFLAATSSIASSFTLCSLFEVSFARDWKKRSVLETKECSNPRKPHMHKHAPDTASMGFWFPRGLVVEAESIICCMSSTLLIQPRWGLSSLADSLWRRRASVKQVLDTFCWDLRCKQHSVVPNHSSDSMRSECIILTTLLFLFPPKLCMNS